MLCEQQWGINDNKHMIFIAHDHALKGTYFQKLRQEEDIDNTERME